MLPSVDESRSSHYTPYKPSLAIDDTTRIRASLRVYEALTGHGYEPRQYEARSHKSLDALSVVTAHTERKAKGKHTAHGRGAGTRDLLDRTFV